MKKGKKEMGSNEKVKRARALCELALSTAEVSTDKEIAESERISLNNCAENPEVLELVKLFWAAVRSIREDMNNEREVTNGR